MGAPVSHATRGANSVFEARAKTVSETGYTAAFWTRAAMLQNAKLKMCEKCYAKDGEETMPSFTRKNPKRRTFVVVRVALRIGRRIHPDNLGLFCTKCRRGGIRKSPKPQPAELMDGLFPEERSAAEF